jgi:hypothetical protein
MKRHATGLYHAVVFDNPPSAEFTLSTGRWVYRGDGAWLARLPVVVGVVTGLTMWAVTAGVLYAA